MKRQMLTNGADFGNGENKARCLVKTDVQPHCHHNIIKIQHVVGRRQIERKPKNLPPDKKQMFANGVDFGKGGVKRQMLINCVDFGKGVTRHVLTKWC